MRDSSISIISLQSDVTLCDAVVFTILRHLSLSSAALTASCSVIPVELLMSLSHDVGGRPLFLFPLTFPVMIVLSSPFLRITCPKKRNFRLCTISRSISLFPILSKTHALVFLCVHGIIRTLLSHHISKASTLHSSAFCIVHDSLPYIAMGKAVAHSTLSLRFKLTLRLLQMLPIINNTTRNLATMHINLDRIVHLHFYIIHRLLYTKRKPGHFWI